MKQIAYKNIAESIKENSGLVKVLCALDKAITYITVLLYVGLIGYLTFLVLYFGTGIQALYQSILIPGVSFIIVSIYRKLVSAPRPYEVFDFTPVINKDTVGKSFPSRHVFSIFMVAMTFLQFSVSLAVLISALGILLAVVRVLGGVHFLKDVIAGATLGILCGVIGFGILCGVFGIGMLVF